MSTVISVENLSKSYQLGQIGTGTFAHDLNVWWAKMRGKPNPMLRIGETDQGHLDGEELWALKDVSFTVRQGEVLGIIGRNGAGKSTLLKILSRVTAPTSGVVKVKGRIASLLEVGTGFHPELTGRENVYLNGAILGMSRKEIDGKFDEIVDFSGVEKFIDTPVKRYSSGMYVRLAFAVAAHLDPEILVVDEVLAVGDAEFQKKCLGKMGEVAQGGRTVLFVSHNMGAVQNLCDRAILLLQGSLILDNKTHLVVDKYLSFNKGIESGKDLSSLKRTKGLGEIVKFSKCQIFDSVDNESLLLKFGEPFSIQLEWIATVALENLSVVVGVDAADEHRVCTTASEDRDILFSVLPLEKHSAKTKITKNLLVPGTYWLTVSLRQGRLGLDQLVRVVKFEISHLSYNGVKPHAGFWGYLRLESEWV